MRRRSARRNLPGRLAAGLAGLTLLLVLAAPGGGQSPAPTPAPSATAAPPTATATLTVEPLVVSTVEPTITPAMAVELRQPPAAPKSFWDKYGVIVAIVGVIVGVFLKRLAEAVADGAARLAHLLFDRFASAPLLRRLYYRRYRETLAARVRELASSNIVNRPVDLARVYVPIQLSPETRARGDDEADLIGWDEARRQRQRARAIEPWAAVRHYPRLVVLGEPGAGKTTYLSHLAYVCAQGQAPPDFARYVPIYVPLRQLVGARRVEDALPGVFEAYNFPHAAAFCRRQLAAGRCLLLLDGLDELDTQEQHNQVVRLVQDFADRRPPAYAGAGDDRNVIVVSCRTFSYEHSAQLRGFTKAEVMDFDDEAIVRFADAWFRAADVPELIAPFDRLLKAHRRLRELARNPLLLLLVVDHYQRERSLPRSRAELYTVCVNTRIAAWNQHKGTHRGRFDETQKRNLLHDVALNLYLEERRSLFRRDELLAQVANFLAADQDPPGSPAELLAEIVAHSGLLRERAIGRYGFSHLTLQEFFAAEALTRRGPDEAARLMGSRLADDRWQEVILLYCGLAKQADALLKGVLARAQHAGQAGWLQAGRCLAEGARIKDGALRQAAADGLLALLRGDDGGLTPGESAAIVTLLWEGAAQLAPGYVRELLAAGDLALAARLLPQGDDAPPARRAEIAALRDELSVQLTAAYERGDAAQRRQAMSALSGIQVGADRAALGVLLRGLEEREPAARAEAARALGRLAAPDEAVVAGLRRVYETDAEQAARLAARNALLRLGRPALVGLVFIPAGEFLMGSAPDDKMAHDDEKPQRALYLPDYYIARTPTTNAEFARFIEDGGYRQRALWSEAGWRWKEEQGRAQPRYWSDDRWNGPQLPVVGVSWHEASAYARWAGGALPGEAEWEKAARGADGRLWPWGNEWHAGRCNSKESGLGRTTPVGRYSPYFYPELVEGGDSPYGVADMAGNVWQWTADWYQAYPESSYRSDEFGERYRVLRGGAWDFNQRLARCAFRLRYLPVNYNNGVGFRVLASLASSEY